MLLAELRSPGDGKREQIGAGRSGGSKACHRLNDGSAGDGRERGAHDLMDYGMSGVDWLCDQGL